MSLFNKNPDKTLSTDRQTVLREKCVLTREALGSLPWCGFKHRNVGGEWLFSDFGSPITESLRDYLIQIGGEADLHGFHYRFGGIGHKFLNRFKLRGDVLDEGKTEN